MYWKVTGCWARAGTGDNKSKRMHTGAQALGRVTVQQCLARVGTPASNDNLRWITGLQASPISDCRSVRQPRYRTFFLDLEQLKSSSHYTSQSRPQLLLTCRLLNMS